MTAPSGLHTLNWVLYISNRHWKNFCLKCPQPYTLWVWRFHGLEEEWVHQETWLWFQRIGNWYSPLAIAGSLGFCNRKKEKGFPTEHQFQGPLCCYYSMRHEELWLEPRGFTGISCVFPYLVVLNWALQECIKDNTTKSSEFSEWRFGSSQQAKIYPAEVPEEGNHLGLMTMVAVFPKVSFPTVILQALFMKNMSLAKILGFGGIWLTCHSPTKVQ